ncbi:formyltetrahydrofolate deformylase [Paracoccus thiocyanatus]|uniref:Formyltetrahydrofolate deformylase n=1 Tax=Paracoccus thiocyanatus TaxID=34006 RepID=A0A1N6NAG1_9RHOB|nr:formyltetrahydrofolate deformylase [Paracoccus thiocyanatus]SIP89045.1 formyltetrahydrofolate deformylase [Paracoccus thiocyanatus]
MSEKEYILTLSCDDQSAIVATLTGRLADFGGNILESAQFGDGTTGRFFMRIRFVCPGDKTKDQIRHALSPAVARFDMRLNLYEADKLPKIIVMVSRFDHCFEHLLYQIRVGWLKAEIVAVVSNHEEARASAEAAGLPYYHWPVSKDNKAEQEARLQELADSTGADLIVLARYMQVLSDNFSKAQFGRIINIHHSFLPSFKGAKPYHQAYDRGVKSIGATAHYVTADLDEGPIIEQQTERVGHALSADDLVAVGRDIETRVLAKAVKLHLERRVFLNGHRTVVFE